MYILTSVRFFLHNSETGRVFNEILPIPSLLIETFGHTKNFWIRPYILGGEDPKERSNLGLKIEFFHFFSLKFGLACRKVEASQGFWYQGVGTDILFRN